MKAPKDVEKKAYRIRNAVSFCYEQGLFHLHSLLRRLGLNVLGHSSLGHKGKLFCACCLYIFLFFLWCPASMFLVISIFELEWWARLNWRYQVGRPRPYLTPRTSGMECENMSLDNNKVMICLQALPKFCKDLFLGISQWIRAAKDLGFPRFSSQIILSGKCWAELIGSIFWKMGKSQVKEKLLILLARKRLRPCRRKRQVSTENIQKWKGLHWCKLQHWRKPRM